MSSTAANARATTGDNNYLLLESIVAKNRLVTHGINSLVVKQAAANKHRIKILAKN
jgi:hypothetical protein